jgi:hypothetical protein
MDAIFRLSDAGKRDPVIEEWLNRTDGLTAIARKWFSRMRACGDDVLELMHDGYPTVCVEDAPFAYVGVFKNHTNVGFFCGAHLADPARLLEGSGKNMRHVKLRHGRELETAALADSARSDAAPKDAALERLIDCAYLDIKSRLRCA